MPWRCTISAIATSTFASCAAWPTTFRRRPGRKKRSTTSPPISSSTTRTRRRTRRSGRCTRGFPGGRYAERAAWKIGWLAYRNQQYADTIRVFEARPPRFPRSDYRPPWLYWSARAHEALKETEPGAGALHAGRDRLFQQLLRPAGAHASRRRHPAAARRRVGRAGGRVVGGAADFEGGRAGRSRFLRIEQLVRALLGARPLRSGDQRAAVPRRKSGATRRRFRRRSPGPTRSRARRRRAGRSSRSTAPPSTR